MHRQPTQLPVVRGHHDPASPEEEPRDRRLRVTSRACPSPRVSGNPAHTRHRPAIARVGRRPIRTLRGLTKPLLFRIITHA